MNKMGINPPPKSPKPSHLKSVGFKDNKNLAKIFNKKGEINMTSTEMCMGYEIKKLKVKLNLCSDIATGIDKKLLDLEIKEGKDLKYIRDELRDLRDFMKEN